MKSGWLLAAVIGLGAGLTVNSQATAEGEGEGLLFGFEEGERPWRAVNDDVMGGISRGSSRVTGDGNLEFSGDLSLENRGGFSSVRSPMARRDLSSGEGILLRVRGDGRTYSFNIHTNIPIPAGSYQADFETTAGEWLEVRLPWSSFVATSFGQPMRRWFRMNPKKVRYFSFMIADKKAGPFQLLVDRIELYDSSSEAPSRPAESAAPEGAGTSVVESVAEGTQPGLGDRVNDFSLADESGREVSLSELLRAGPVVVYFYPSDFTPVCTRQACMFRDAHEALVGAGVRIIGISPQSKASHDQFRARYDLPFPLLADTEKRVIRSWGVEGPLGIGVRRISFLVNREGVVEDMAVADISVDDHEEFVARVLDRYGRRFR